MDILFQVADWIKVVGSLASVGLAIYFIVRAIKTRAIAKKPLRDQKKKDKAYKELVILAKDLGISLKTDEKKDEVK